MTETMLIAALLLVSMSPGAAAGQEQAGLTGPQRDAVRSARTARIIVTQQFDADSVRLPFDEPVRTLLEHAGLTIVDRGDAGLVVRIEATGQAIGTRYYVQWSGASRVVYNGARLSGRLSFETADVPPFVAPFNGAVEPPSSILVVEGSSASAPTDSPFGTAYLADGSFLPVLLSAAAATYGPGPLTEALLDIDGFFGVMRRSQGDLYGSGGTSEAIPRRRLLEALGRTNDSSTTRRFVAVLAERSHPERLAGIRYQHYLDTPTALTYAVRESPSAAVRAEAASVLRKYSAAQALGRIRDTSSVPNLIGALQGEHVMVSEAAVVALGALADRRAVSPLAALLRRSRPSPLRVAAAEALGRIGDSEAVPALAETVRERAGPVSYAALGALGHLQGVDALLPFLADSEFGSFVAGELGDLHDRRAITPLSDALRSHRLPAAAFALARLEAFDVLVPLLADSFPLALDVSHAMGLTKAPRVTELLMALLERGGAVPPLVFQTLRSVTGQSLRNDPQAWLDWWTRSR